MTTKCRCTDAHALDCHWFTPDREAYDVLAAKLVEVTDERDRLLGLALFREQRALAERNRARSLAVALEQQVARIEGLASMWEADDREHLNTFGQHLPASVACLAEMLRAALDKP